MAVRPIDILVVDDDPHLRQLLSFSLPEPGFRVNAVASGAEALAIIASREPDVVVLDVRMPGMDGLETCRRLRRFSTIPVLMLTAAATEADAALGLEAGADDYVRKPFTVVELRARLQALVRRATQLNKPPPDGILRLDEGRLHIDIVRPEVNVDDHWAHLSPLEHRLLVCLATNWDRAVSHAELSAALWGADVGVRPEVLRVLVQNVRRKLGPGRDYIVSEYSTGYRLNAVLVPHATATPSHDPGPT